MEKVFFYTRRRKIRPLTPAMPNRASIVTLAILAFAELLGPVGGVRAENPEPAPPLSISEMIRGPETAGISWENLVGQAVILEFWATWCGPCVSAIPHWNDLVEQFESEPVRFLSISNEKPEVVKSFLDRRPIDGWVAIDADHKTWRAYEVTGIPKTFMIDAAGQIRAITYPNHVDSDAIRALLAGKTPEVPSAVDNVQQFEVALDDEGGPRPLFEARIKPSTSEYTAASSGQGLFKAINMPAAVAVTVAMKISEARLVFECDQPEQKYDFSFVSPAHDELDALIIRSLESAFGWSIRKETREVPVYILTASAESIGKLATSPDETPHMRFSVAEIEGVTTPESILRNLESRLSRPLIDESDWGDVERIEVALTWDATGGQTALVKALEEQLGFQVREDRREVEVVVVSEAPSE